MDWKKKAYHLYFDEHKSINEIAKILSKSRQSVSKFLNANNLSEEKEKRKEISKDKHREANRKSMQKARFKRKTSFVEDALVKRQHIIDVNVLSREKYFN